MSVYRDTNQTVYFDHPIADEGVDLTATVYRDGAVIKAASLATLAGGRYSLALTYRETQYDANLVITWENADKSFSRKTYVDVVTPLLTPSQLQDVYLRNDETVPSALELLELEQTVRVFIEAFTGQRFGFSAGSKSIVGNGGTKIALPQRLSNLVSVTGGWPGAIAVSNDGWSLTVKPETSLDIRQAPPEEFQNNYLTGQGGTIRIPSWYIERFNTGVNFLVTGEWGYDYVPDEVVEAAMLLANDFSLNETVYRDRYLQSIKIQQDTVTYHPGAFRGTGNARADLLLGKYKKPGMVII